MSEWTTELTRASKFLSLVLRHRPEAAGIALDANGWAEIDALLEGAPFWRATNGVWLCESVPAARLTVIE